MKKGSKEKQVKVATKNHKTTAASRRDRFIIGSAAAAKNSKPFFEPQKNNNNCNVLDNDNPNSDKEKVSHNFHRATFLVEMD